LLFAFGNLIYTDPLGTKGLISVIYIVNVPVLSPFSDFDEDAFTILLTVRGL